MKNFKKIAFMAAMVLVSSQAFADVWCTEEIKTVIPHADGNVYFDSTNAVWVQVPGNQKAVDRSYMQLTLAMQKKIPLTVQWLGTNVCDTTSVAMTAKKPNLFLMKAQDIK